MSQRRCNVRTTVM